MSRYLLMGVMLIVSAHPQAAVYRWIDDSGTTHYSDRPPIGDARTRVDLPSASTAPSAPAPSLRRLERKVLDELARHRRAVRDRRAAEIEQTRLRRKKLAEDCAELARRSEQQADIASIAVEKRRFGCGRR